MDQKERDERIKDRQRRLVHKDLFLNLLLLLPPILLTLIIVATALYTFILSLALLYFVLPMYYTVEKRMRYSVTGIGKDNFTYADGYRAFFKSNMGGIFGIINILVTFLLLLIVLAFLFELAFVPLLRCFPQSYEAYLELGKLTSDPSFQLADQYQFMIDNGHAFTQPLTILVGVTAFLPLAYALFYAVPSNLDNHQIATIVLPDIDKNLSAAQARTLSRIQFARNFQGYRWKNSLRLNWPFLLSFTLLYGLSLYGCSMITTTNTYVMPVILLLCPSLSVLYGTFFVYFWVGNDYAVLEESQDVLLSSLPPQIRATVYQTYCNPSYIHGEESAARGCFVPATDQPGTPDFPSDAEGTPSPFPPSFEEERKPEEAQKTQEQPTGVVIDLSQEEEKDEEK